MTSKQTSKHLSARFFAALLFASCLAPGSLAQSYQGREVNGLWTGTVTAGGEASSAKVNIQRVGTSVQSTWNMVAGPLSRPAMNMQAAGKLNGAGTELAFDGQVIHPEAAQAACTLQITAAVTSAPNTGPVGEYSALKMAGEGVLAGPTCGSAAGRKVSFELTQVSTL